MVLLLSLMSCGNRPNTKVNVENNADSTNTTISINQGNGATSSVSFSTNNDSINIKVK